LKTNSHILLSAGRKLVALLLLGGLTIASFATLGDGKVVKGKTHKVLSTKATDKAKSFSLRSGYNFRGQQVINFQENRYVNLNTNVTYQQGRTVYSIPLKKKLILNNKVTFNPNSATRN
jgi:hypothetical protein